MPVVENTIPADDKKKNAKSDAIYALRDLCRACDDIARAADDANLPADYKEELKELVETIKPYRDKADDAIQQLLYGVSDDPEETEAGEDGKPPKATGEMRIKQVGYIKRLAGAGKGA
jgi:hypothetical protein